MVQLRRLRPRCSEQCAVADNAWRCLNRGIDPTPHNILSIPLARRARHRYVAERPRKGRVAGRTLKRKAISLMLYHEVLATFRGDHAFEPDHLKMAYLAWLKGEGHSVAPDADAEEWIDAALDRSGDGRCPRCDGPLAGVSLVDEHIFRAEDERQVRAYIAARAPDWYGFTHLAASRVTECRCVPVCRLCENDEAIVGIALGWPMNRAEIVERLRAAYGNNAATDDPRFTSVSRTRNPS